MVGLAQTGSGIGSNVMIGGIPKVLVVDDDRVVLTTLAEGLSQAGFTPIKAASGLEAVRACTTDCPDAVVMDVRLPDMTGIDAGRTIQDHCRAPILFLSAACADETVEAAISAGGWGYLVKPVRIKELAISIRAMLARSAERNSLQRAEQNLRIALQAKRNVSVAVGVLMERYRLGPKAALELLRRHARSRRRKLDGVAAEIVTALETVNALPREH